MNKKMEKIDAKDKMKVIMETDFYRLYLFTPTWIKQFPVSGHMHTMTWMQRIRFWSMKHSGYKVYVLTDLYDTVIGEITFSRGGGWKYPFSTPKDLIYGPSFVQTEFRGKGYAVLIGKIVLNSFEKDFDKVYATVREENISSLRCLEKTGFQIDKKLRADKLRRFHEDANGDHWLAVYVTG